MPLDLEIAQSKFDFASGGVKGKEGKGDSVGASWGNAKSAGADWTENLTNEKPQHHRHTVKTSGQQLRGNSFPKSINFDVHSKVSFS